MARLTLNGMYEYEPSIFDGMILPEDYDKPTLLFEILQRSGQLYPYHQQPLILKEGIRLWFARNYLNFDRTMAALTAEYNPIENVYENRKETTTYGSSTIMSGGHKDANSGKDTVTHSEKDTTERSYDDYKDTTERSYSDDYLDKTERSYDQYKEDLTHDYTDSNNQYTELMKMQGSHVTEQQVSAFDGSGYQPSTIESETYGKNLTPNADPRQDAKTISGKYKDTKDTTGSYKDENTVEGTYKDENTVEGTYKDETTYGHKITTDNGLTMTRTYQQETESHAGTDTFEVFRHGNIGVTSNQHMINEELELRKFDIYVDIARRFENEFIVQVY